MKSLAIVVGGSAGSLRVLDGLLEALPLDLPVPILVVVHVGPDDHGQCAGSLRWSSCLPVIEPCDKTMLEAGRVYVAPANYHMLVERDGVISLSVDERVNWSRPSIDVLFESSARSWEHHVTGLLLSGASTDGTQGLRAIKAAGGYTLAQNPDDADYPLMPRSAINAGWVDEMVRPDCMAWRLLQLISGD